MLFVNLANSLLNSTEYTNLVKSLNQNRENKHGDKLYFDYAAKSYMATNYIDQVSQDMQTHLYGNPHSESPSSSYATDVIDDVRKTITKSLGDIDNQYILLFAFNDAQAMRIVAESLNFTDQSRFQYTFNSNNNILGLRPIAARRGARSVVYAIPENYTEHKFKNLPMNLTGTPDLTILPLADEFTGELLSDDQILAVINQREKGRHNIVMADASLYLQSKNIDLKKMPFHAVAFSFEKIYGYPNIGCVVVHKSLITHMIKPYIAGGTLVYALTESDFEKIRIPPTERFEDGSLPFVAIASIQAAYNMTRQLGIDNIHEHSIQMASALRQKLASLKHPSGKPVVAIYGQGSTVVTFNVLDATGAVISYHDVVERGADKFAISAGCMDSPGTCYEALGITEETVVSAIEAGRDPPDVGAVRASVGWATSESDLTALSDWIQATYGQ